MRQGSPDPSDLVIFLETFVLVAACQDNHVSHRESFDLLQALSPKSGCTSIHCVTELYSVVTPVATTASHLRWKRGNLSTDSRSPFVVSLSTGEALQTINRFMGRGLDGGMIYDALVVAGARKIDAEKIYTFNEKHFYQVAPDLVSRIVLP